MHSQRLAGIKACVFDAYGTLFDVSSVARGAKETLGTRWETFSDQWRSKQLQYTWLRGLSGRHADFWQVTGDALDFAMDSLQLDDRDLRTRLMDRYLGLSAFPEVPQTLQRLKDGGMKLAILSNGTPAMLESAASHAGISALFDAVISVEEVGVFKPHPAVYRLPMDRLGIEGTEICFLSSNGWDAYSAKASGLRVIWCNRFGQAEERLPSPPDGVIKDLSPLPGIVLA
jgi:2-haloacid dehalogenase